MQRMPVVSSLMLGVAVTITIVAACRAQEEEPQKRLSPGEVLAASSADEWRLLAPENTLYLELEAGRVVIELAPDFAPRHVARIKSLARAGFYDGLEFYRVVDGFVAQAGDLEGSRDPGDLGRTTAAELERAAAGLEFTPLGAADGYAPEVGYSRGFAAARDAAADRSWLVHCPGAVAMARGNEPDSGGTEFYVVLGHAPRYLDRNLTIFGRVVEGQWLLQSLPRGADASGMIAPEAPRGKILSLRVAADLPVEERTALEVLRTDAASFRALIASRRNRPEAFFVHRSDFIDVCGVTVPARPVAAIGE